MRDREREHERELQSNESTAVEEQQCSRDKEEKNGSDRRGQGWPGQLQVMVSQLQLTEYPDIS